MWYDIRVCNFEKKKKKNLFDAYINRMTLFFDSQTTTVYAKLLRHKVTCIYIYILYTYIYVHIYIHKCQHVDANDEIVALKCTKHMQMYSCVIKCKLGALNRFNYIQNVADH